MARPWRIQFEDAVYHITTRGNHHQEIFRDDRDREFFLELLGRAVERFQFQIFAFCLMTNHYHLFLRTPEANLSRAMHWINTTYTTYFNRRHQESGHLFQGRFKSVLVADEAHYLQLSMYVHLNPVRAKMVEHPAEHPWSSFRDYAVSKSRRAWLSRSEILSHYGSDLLCHRRYQKECLGLIGKEPTFVKQLKNGVIIGSRSMLKELRKKHPPGGKTEPVTEFQRAGKREVDLGRELEKVAESFGVRAGDLRKRYQSLPLRLAAYHHLVEKCGMSVQEVAEEFEVSASAVSHGIKRFQQQSPKTQKTLPRSQ